MHLTQSADWVLRTRSFYKYIYVCGYKKGKRVREQLSSGCRNNAKNWLNPSYYTMPEKIRVVMRQSNICCPCSVVQNNPERPFFSNWPASPSMKAVTFTLLSSPRQVVWDGLNSHLLSSRPTWSYLHLAFCCGIHGVINISFSSSFLVCFLRFWFLNLNFRYERNKRKNNNTPWLPLEIL